MHKSIGMASCFLEIFCAELGHKNLILFSLLIPIKVRSGFVD